MKTVISKSMRGNWEAETCIELGQKNRELQITTTKSDRGVYTSASVVTINSDDEGHKWITFAVFGDFRETLIVEAKRCTEKTVREQHDVVLKDIESIKARALHFYAAKDAVAA